MRVFYYIASTFENTLLDRKGPSPRLSYFGCHVPFHQPSVIKSPVRLETMRDTPARSLVARSYV